MVQSGEVWATEATGMNDYSEIVAGEAYVGERWASEKAGLVSALGRDKVDIIDECLLGNIVVSDGMDGVFVACASSVRDDANQWRLYADDGRGFSVEFDTSVRLEIAVGVRPGDDDISAWERPINGSVTTWGPVLYEPATRARAFGDLMEWASGLTGIFDRSSWGSVDLDVMRDANYADMAYRIGSSLGRMAQFVKGPGFAGENESRLVVTLQHGADPEIVSFRASAVGVVRYLRVRTAGVLHADDERSRKDPLLPLPIRRVIVGPAQSFKLVKPSVEALLERYGYKDVPVEPSTTSLRWT